MLNLAELEGLWGQWRLRQEPRLDMQVGARLLRVSSATLGP